VDAEPAPAGAGEHVGRELRAEALNHTRQDLVGRHPAHELVRVREQITLDARAGDAELAEERRVVRDTNDRRGARDAVALELASELSNGRALRVEDDVLLDPTGLEEPEDAQGVGGALDFVLPGLESARAAPSQAQPLRTPRDSGRLRRSRASWRS